MRSSRLFDLTGRSALVTGGAQGLGKAIAVGLSAHGARVAVVDVNEPGAEAVAKELGGSGAEALAIRADVTVEAEVSSAVSEVVRRWGGLEILVNNAGIALPGPAEAATLS